MLDVRIDRKDYSGRVSNSAPFQALQDFHFQIEDGQFACLIGPSGCGKSTLLNIIGGLDRQFAGQVMLDGHIPDGDIGYMFQSPRLMPWLTVIDNVKLVLPDTSTADQRARELLTAMALDDVLDAYPNRLSGGMQRRVALARAFATEPKLLLMDEPFISLDAPAAGRLRAMLIELWQRRRTKVLFVTHDLREALALGDKVMFMTASPGRIILEKTIELPRPRTVDDAEIAALHARLLGQHPQLLSGELDTDLPT